MSNLLEQVLSYIIVPEPARFDSLALAVFRYQATHVPAYRAYLAKLGIDPQRVRSLEDIPPVSALAFKYVRIENEFHPESAGSRVFVTSGTTVGRDQRGRHLVPALEIYRASAIGHLRRMMFPDGVRTAMLALHPTAERMPESSLAQMISWCIDEFGNGDALCAATRESVDEAHAIEFLRSSRRLNRPVCILGTTASFATLFAAMRVNGSPILLPEGSRLMDTGGAKGQRIPMNPDQVVAEAHELLGIEPSLVINEYGMTEMCSQLYDATSFNSEYSAPPPMRIKLAPPWLKAAALDPTTLKPNTSGEPGILAFFDLANVGSISALMTEDIGIVQHETVMLLGRAAAADPRGCALAIKQFVQATKPLLSYEPRAVTHTALVTGELHYGVRAADPRDAAATADIEVAARRLTRMLTVESASIDPDTLGAMLNEVKQAVVSDSVRWRGSIREIAARLSYSESLLARSLQTLLRPLNSVGEFAGKLRRRRELLGFIMPGNVPGAGIHELVTALAAGCTAIVKTSSSEPVFFREFANTLRELDARFRTDLGVRVEVFNWTRERDDLTEALLKQCNYVIAFGDDLTIDQLEQFSRQGQLIGFPSRVSVAVVMGSAITGKGMTRTADALALDCAIFDQRGCLSPHHIFVEERACEFASEIAAAFSRLAPLLGSNDRLRSLELQDGAAIRRVRETGRWRWFGGRDVKLWEDPNFGWTVVFDSAASFVASPGFRTVCVSPFRDPSDLEYRLEPVHGRIEGFAIAAGEAAAAGSLPTGGSEKGHGLAAIRAIASRCGATYVCGPGEIQSPPFSWPHGGGDFIRMFIG